LNKSSYTLKGSSASVTLTATVSPSNATNKTVTWSSSNTSVAKVSSSGKVTPVGDGTAVITAKTANGKPAYCTITVKNYGKGTVITNSSWNTSVSNKASENKPHYENKASSRGADAYNTVIDQFNVTTNTRYKRTSSSTYCNIFAWDVMSAMNVTLPHWVKNNVPATSSTKGATELTANATYTWLENYGAQYGWKKVSASEAQKRANSGYPTVAVWKNTSGGSGHIAVVRPETSKYTYSDSKGPVIAQAGGTNYSITNVSTGFGKSKMNSIVYWTHD
jgi:hypothetical protein